MKQLAAAVLVLAACFGEPRVVERIVVKVQRVVEHDRVPCVDVPPPMAPVTIVDGNWEGLPKEHGTVIDCSQLSPEDCWGISIAAWADHGHALSAWSRLYVWPVCHAGEVTP